jgi:hypothetical protein
MIRDNHADGIVFGDATLHDYMTPALPNLDKPVPFQDGAHLPA